MAHEVKVWTRDSAAAAIAGCVKNDNDGYTWFSSRAFMDVVGYSTWQKFTPVIERAQILCVKSGFRVDDHFRRTFHEITPGQLQADIETSREGFNRLIQCIDSRKKIASEIKNAIANVLSAVQYQRLVSEVDLELRPNLPWSTRFKLYHKDHISYVRLNLPDYFSVSSHAIDLIFLIEDEAYHHFLPMRPNDLPDGSIGIRWAQQRREWRNQGLYFPDYHLTAPMRVPCRKQKVQVHVYHKRELLTYLDWLYNTYVPIYLVKYALKKPEFRGIPDCVKVSLGHNVAKFVSKIPIQIEPKYRPDLIRVYRAGGFVPNDGKQATMLPGEQMGLEFGETKRLQDG